MSRKAKRPKDWMPKVGDVVRFNDWGLEQVYNRASGLAHMKTLELTITWVDFESMTEPEKTYVVNVSDPEINRYMIDSACFDLVHRPSKEPK